MQRTARFNDLEKPMVTVVLHNNNNGRHLKECLDSIMNQTYDNLEICLYDFACTDNSWDIAVKFHREHPGILTLMRMRRDYSPDGLVNHVQNIRGKYFIRYYSNCTMKPGLIEKCVQVFEKNADVAFVKIRKILADDSGGEVAERPFYRCSCIVPGIRHLPNHLMHNPAVFSQISMFNTDIVKINVFSTSFTNDPYLDEALLCLNYDMAYIHEPLIVYRENSRFHFPGEPKYLADVFSLFLSKVSLIKSLQMTGNYQNSNELLQQSLNKLGLQCLQYASDAFVKGHETDAKRFYYLAPAIAPAIAEHQVFQKLQDLWESDPNRKNYTAKELKLNVSAKNDIDGFPLPQGSQTLTNL